MKLGSLLKSSVVALLMVSISPAGATDAEVSDATLVAALHTIADSKLVGMTQAEYQAWDYSLNAQLIGLLSVAGAAAGAAVIHVPNEILTELSLLSPSQLNYVRGVIRAHGLKAAGISLLAFGFNAVASKSYANQDQEDAAKLRAAAVKTPGVYRTEMEHFRRLSLPTQFLIAKQDPQFARDLVQFAQSLEQGQFLKAK